MSTHRISDPRSGPAQLLPSHVKQRSHPHGVRPQMMKHFISGSFFCVVSFFPQHFHFFSLCNSLKLWQLIGKTAITKHFGRMVVLYSDVILFSTMFVELFMSPGYVVGNEVKGVIFDTLVLPIVP